MLPSRKQEIRQTRQQPPASTSTTTNTSTRFDNDNDNITTTNHSRQQQPSFEVRQQSKRHQHSQGYHPYVSSGTGRKHRKHRSQPSNFLDDDLLLLNAAKAIISQNASERSNASLFPNENQEGGRFGETARYRSMLSSSMKSDSSLSDVTNSMTNAQAQPQYELARPRTPPSCNFNYMPVTPGNTYDNFLPQQSSIAQQYAQQTLINQIMATPISRTERKRRPDVKILTPMRAATQTVTATETQVNPRRRHSLDTSPYRQQDAFFSSVQSGLPSPPNTAPLMSVSQFDMAPMPHPEYASIAGFAMGTSDNDTESYFSPSSSDNNSTDGQESPIMETMDEFMQGQIFDISSPCPEASMFVQVNPDNILGAPLQSNFCNLAPAPSSVSRLVPNALYHKEEHISEAFIKDSGISNEEIASYISGPEISDGKWVCLFPECNKRFGRKENIKSHVQTHLGDRQFRCDVCKKCFVRQHDLKRHSKIHTGVKPYPCKCGNSFARHDALTRHRQRGMCIGAFEGIVKKIVKRGRPKKIRDGSDNENGSSSNGKRRNGSSSQGGSSRSGSEETSSPPAFEEHDLFDMPTSPSSRKPEQITQTDSRKRARSPQSEGEQEYDASKQFNRADAKRQLMESSFQSPLNSFDHTPPSSPPFEQTDEVTTPGDHQFTFADSSFAPLGLADLSFTPLGSPSYDVVHRRLASAYNTPEWSGPSIADQEVDLRDILGLDALGDASEPLNFDGGDWSKNGMMGMNMGMNLGMGMDMGMGLMEDGFDFIKSELLNNDGLDLWDATSP